MSAENRGGGSQSDSESEGGDQPSAENSASSGSRSTSLNNPKKRSKKVRLEEEGRQEKKRKKREVLLTSFHRYLPRIVFRCWLFFLFFASTARENPPKHKVEREKCEATGLCVSTRLQDSLLIHAVQCNGTWTWILLLSNVVITVFVIPGFLWYCPVLAPIEKCGEVG